MRTDAKLVLTALAASAILALAVGGASARSFSTNEKNFELIWNNALTGKTKFSFLMRGVGARIECNVTLLGGFTNNTIAKSTNTNQGTIRHGELESCTGGTLTIRTETLPWNLRYRSFAGTLPTIRSITTGLLNATFLVTPTSLPTCEFATEANEPGVGIIGNSRTAETGLERTGEPENITAEEGNRIRLFGNFGCTIAGSAEFEGRGLIRNLPRTAKVRVTLI